jgi:hypothetical protein
MASEYAGVERRRVARVGPPGLQECRLEIRARVRLLDISESGTLLASEVRLPAGTRAHLRTGLAAGPLTPVVEIRRGEDRPVEQPSVPALGATFVEMDEQSRRSLEAFLTKATE